MHGCARMCSLTFDFHTNKKVCDETAVINSKRLRNKIAGFVTVRRRHRLLGCCCSACDDLRMAVCVRAFWEWARLRACAVARVLCGYVCST